MKTILILEDNEERITAFRRAINQLGEGYELKVWRDAPSMIAECEAFFPTAALISLDHDLDLASGATADPGAGLDAAQFLGDFLPACPVLLHSSNTDRAYLMFNELRFAGWNVEILDRIGGPGSEWVQSSWLASAQRLLAEHPNTWTATLPSDHAARVDRMMWSLAGLSIGDALGEMLAYRAHTAPDRLRSNDLPAGPWFHTDDTEMAISVAAALKHHGYVHKDALSKRFVRRFERDPKRGYGKMTRIQMREILASEHWHTTSTKAFGGRGSMGNGGAMRVAPLGAYFAKEPERAASEAEASSVVTHTHPEGIAGTIATAVAASAAWRFRVMDRAERPRRIFEEVLRLTPASEVRRKLLLASQTPADTGPEAAAQALGRGDLVTAPDTVPFCLWVAAHHLENYVEALSQTICVGGDCDTNAAIVGGIVALSAGREAISADWLKAREQVQI